MKQQTEGEIFWEGYDKGVKKATSVIRKTLKGQRYSSDEGLQHVICRLRENVFIELKKLTPKE